MLDRGWRLRFPFTASVGPIFGLLTNPIDGARGLDCSPRGGPKFNVNGDRIDVRVEVTTDYVLEGLTLTYVRAASDCSLCVVSSCLGIGIHWR